jgi:tetratricopeptide (TPR) repeat protein
MGDKALTDHPSREELLAVVRGGLTPERAGAILRHLYKGCETCFATAPSSLKAGFGLEAKMTAEEEAALDAAIDGVFTVALNHNQHLRQQESEAKKAEKILAAGGMEAAAKLSRKMGMLGKYKAFQARSWSLRHENTEWMVFFARLAAQCAKRLSPRRYGAERVFDFQCRAQAELGNALRVSDQLDKAADAFARARRLFELGSRSKLLEILLLNLESSADMDGRRFNLASVKLKKIYRHFLRQGDPHHAGRALLKLALCTRFSGNPSASLKLTRQSLELIDAQLDPSLAYAALHNEVSVLSDLGQFKDAEKQLFHLRARKSDSGGHINQLRFRWEQGRIENGLGRFKRAEESFRETQAGLLEVNRAYDSALASLDLSAVLLEQRKAREAEEVVTAAYKIFVALKIEREALMAVLALKTACEVRMASRKLAEEVAKFVRRLENDLNAKFDGKALGE